MSGERDLRTPRPVAERIVELVPHSALVPPALGHSALDTHQLATLNIAHIVAAGRLERLPELAPRIAALHVVDVAEILYDDLDEDVVDLYARHLRDLDSYRVFEPLLGGEPF